MNGDMPIQDPSMMPMPAYQDMQTIIPQQQQESIKFQLEVDEIKRELEFMLMGLEKRWDDKKDDFVYQKVREPLISKEGINKIMIEVGAVVNRNTILTNYTEETIMEIVRRVVGTVIDNLCMRYKKWGIKDKADMSTIINMVENTIKATLFRAKDGFTSDTLRDKERIIESHSQSQQPTGIMQRLGKKLRFG